MSYDFKFGPEFFWFIALAVMGPILAALATFDPDTITDYRVWAAGIGAAAVRALAGALISFFGTATTKS